MLRFALDVDQFRHAHLHAERQLILRYARGDGGIVKSAGLVAVEFAERIEHAAALGARDAGGIVKVENWIALAAEFHPLESPRQKARAPQPVVERLAGLGPSVGGQRHERGQVGVPAAEPVAHPSAHARPAGKHRASLEQRCGRVVVDSIGVHALDHAHIVDDFGQVMQWLAQPSAGLAVAGELERTWGTGERGLAGGHRGLALGRINGLGHFLPEALGQVRLVVEEIHLRRAAGLEKINHPLGLGREVRQTGLATYGVALGRLRVEQRAKRDTAQSERAASKEGTASMLRVEFGQWVHVSFA